MIVSRQAKRLEELWLDADTAEADAKNPQFVEASLSEGFTLSEHKTVIHLITDSEIFGWERPQPRRRLRPVAETPESVYADLQVDDYVVHIVCTRASSRSIDALHRRRGRRACIGPPGRTGLA